MSQLQRFEQNGLELIIDTYSGEVFSNRNALARMCNVEGSTITRWKGSAGIKTISGEILTKGGLQGGAELYNEDAIYQALAKYNPNLLAQCAKAGLRIYLHGLAGFKYEPVQQQSKNYKLPQNYKEALLAIVAEIEAREKVELKLKNATETIGVYRNILSDEVALTFKQIADALEIPKMGRNNLIKFLRNISFLVKKGMAVPRHDQIESGRAIVYTTSYEVHGEKRASQSTKVTFKGLVWILNKLREANYEIKVTARQIWDQYNEVELCEELEQEAIREYLNASKL